MPLHRFRPNTEPATSVLPSEQNVLREFGLELTFVSKPEFSAYPNNVIEARIPQFLISGLIQCIQTQC
jgi:hypothetical protein